MAARMKDPSAVEVAIAHRDGQARLRDDARRTVTTRTSAVEEIERRYVRAADALTKAQRARDERPDDDRTLAALTHAKTDDADWRGKLADARATLGAAQGELAKFEAKLAEAEIAVERAEVQTDLDSPARRDAHRARGRRVFEIAEALHEVMVEHREALAAERELERRAVDLGLAATMTSGLQTARGFVEVLLERGFDLASFASTLAVREVFDVRSDGPVIKQVVLDAAGLAIGALTRTPSVNGRKALLEDVARWADHRSFIDASRAEMEKADAAKHRQPEPEHVKRERERNEREIAAAKARQGLVGIAGRTVNAGSEPRAAACAVSDDKPDPNGPFKSIACLEIGGAARLVLVDGTTIDVKLEHGHQVTPPLPIARVARTGTDAIGIAGIPAGDPR